MKGRKGEREVARLCETWWKKVDKGCSFRRTPLSGGWADVEVRGHFKASGDLMTTSDNWPFTVEVKRREGFSIDNLFKGKRTPAWAWWVQTVTAAKEEDRVPMLWFRKNGGEWLIMLPLEYVSGLLGIGAPDVTWAQLDVEYGDVMPVLYFADRITGQHPKVFLDD